MGPARLGNMASDLVVLDEDLAGSLRWLDLDIEVHRVAALNVVFARLAVGPVMLSSQCH